MAFGYAFAPTSDQAAQAKAGTVSPPAGGQQSLTTLNFKLPSASGDVGAAAEVPGAISPLIGVQPSGGGSLSSAVLQSVLRTVLGPDHANMVLPGAVGAPGTGMPTRIDNGAIAMPVNERAANGPQDYASQSPFRQVQDRPVTQPSGGYATATTVSANKEPTSSPSAPLDLTRQDGDTASRTFAPGAPDFQRNGLSWTSGNGVD